MRASVVLFGVSALLAAIALGRSARTRRLSLSARIQLLVAAILALVALATR